MNRPLFAFYTNVLKRHHILYYQKRKNVNSSQQGVKRKRRKPHVSSGLRYCQRRSNGCTLSMKRISNKFVMVRDAGAGRCPDSVGNVERNRIVNNLEKIMK